MWDFIAELIVQLVTELVPRRAARWLVRVTLVLCGVGLLALAGFSGVQLVSQGPTWVVAGVMVAALGLAWVCGRLLWSEQRERVGT